MYTKSKTKLAESDQKKGQKSKTELNQKSKSEIKQKSKSELKQKSKVEFKDDLIDKKGSKKDPKGKEQSKSVEKGGKEQGKNGKKNSSASLDQKRGKSKDKKSPQKNKAPPKPKKPTLYQLITEFYLAQYKAPIIDADINQVHSWKGQYHNLDINHAYFHWIFPHFQMESGRKRAQLFQTNDEIGKRIVDSYELMLDFYGIALQNQATGQLERKDNYKERYLETFFKPITNSEFRIKRMLQFLNCTGYRIYAIQLVKFLEKEVYKHRKGNFPPLKVLESVFIADWKPYGEIDEKDKKAVEFLEAKCLFPYKTLTNELNVYLKTIQQQQQNENENENEDQ